MDKKYEPLFEPFQVGSVTVKNKFFMAPMATTVDVDEHQCYTPQSIAYYVKRAKGGIGLIITGANWVENEVENHVPAGFPCPTKLPQKYTKKARDLTDRVHAFGTKIFLQLTAGLGRSAVPGAVTNYVAPSTISNRWDPSIECQELTVEQIHHIVEMFGKSAAIAKQSGFDGVEIHAVHEGYLLDCFTLSLFNKRTDEYGGSLENRLRFATEIVQEIKKTCGEDFPVILRYSIKSFVKAIRQGGLPGEDFTELGRDIEESRQAIKLLDEAGYDAFDADAGTYDSWYWAHPPMYFEKGMYLPLVEKIKDCTQKPLLAAGRMDNIEKSLKAINENLIQAVGLGRPVLADPDFVNKIREDRIASIRPCLGCHDGCFGRLLSGGLGSCAVNPECGRETMVGITKADEKKKVVVVGGGPAGMEAARVSALRGYDVVLFEASDALGGELKTGGQPKFKEDDLALIKYYEHELKRLDVEIKLETKATKKKIKKEKPDLVYIAEGSHPIVPPIPGAQEAVLAGDVLTKKVKAGKNVAIIGGGLVGCELALHLAQHGSHVTIVEAKEAILSTGTALAPMNYWMLMDELKFNHIDIHTSAKVTKIEKQTLTYQIKDQEMKLDVDQVVLAVGYRSDSSLYDEIKNDYPLIFHLGDSLQVRNIRAAIWDAYEVARTY